MERHIEESIYGKETHDGDGVVLKRILSLPHVRKFDPFLMLDSFGSDSPLPGPGFPWHPHRGIITITYMIEGAIEHEDSLGNHGIIGAGGVQWMKAASGIIHQEMPHPGKQGIRGLQFWLNLPSDEKMSAPDYGDISVDHIPVVDLAPGVTVSIIAGSISSVRGPLSFKRTSPEMFVFSFDPGSSVVVPYDMGKNFFVVGLTGAPAIGNKPIIPHSAHLLTSGTTVSITAQERSSCMVVGAIPLGEPIAWEGPIVMNSRSELETAFREYRNGTFIH